VGVWREPSPVPEEFLMVAATISHPQRGRSFPNSLYYVYHPSFLQSNAERIYRIEACPAEEGETVSRHMRDDVTRDCSSRMHYAAYRTKQAGAARERGRWQRRYFALRDRIVLGNRKLIFRAIQKWKGANRQADDLIGECDLVLIRVVATYNAGLCIRFSTCAFTCLRRALSRLWAKIRVEQSSQPLFLEHLADRDDLGREDPPATNQWEPLEEFLRDEHALLSEREKSS
jgi:hypothetical protein